MTSAVESNNKRGGNRIDRLFDYATVYTTDVLSAAMTVERECFTMNLYYAGGLTGSELRAFLSAAWAYNKNHGVDRLESDVQLINDYAVPDGEPPRPYIFLEVSSNSGVKLDATLFRSLMAVLGKLTRHPVQLMTKVVKHLETNPYGREYDGKRKSQH